MNIRPVVIIGNGPSIRGFDFSRLDGIDTIAMNGFYKVSQSTGWLPKIYCCFRNLWEREPVEFVKNNEDKLDRVFYLDNINGGMRMFSDWFDCVEKATPINRIIDETVPPEMKKMGWSIPYSVDLDCAVHTLVAKYGEAKGIKMAQDSELPDERLKCSGMVKFVEGRYDDISDKDVLEYRRWSCEYNWPKSFDEFTVGYGDSSTDCARIAVMLGYNLILLIGNDGRFKIKSDGTMDESSWGIDNALNGIPLHLETMVKCSACRTEKGLIDTRKRLWDGFKISLVLHEHPCAVWNCTPNSAIDNLEMHDLDEALKLIRSWK